MGRIHRHSSNKLGFTLLELMVAISIFTILGIGSYRLLSGEIAAQELLRAHSSELQQWQRGLLKLQQDLLQITPRPIRTAYDDKEAALLGDSSQLTFTRSGWSNPLQQARSQLQRVRYRLGKQTALKEDRFDHNDSDHPHLLRDYWRVLDQAQDSEPLTQVVIQSVTSLEIRYLNKQGKWHNEWPSLQQKAFQGADPAQQPSTELPAGIEIRILSPSQGELIKLFSLRDFAPDENQSNEPLGDNLQGGEK